MPKVKPKRHVPTIDMTAMVDVAFLLLTFFILTAQFRAQEREQVDTPYSTGEVKVVTDSTMLITVGESGEVFIGFGRPDVRLAVLERVAKHHRMDSRISDDGRHHFSLLQDFGVSIKQLPNWLGEGRSDVDMKDFVHRGIPLGDKPGEDNELVDWIAAARNVDLAMKFAIKGDNKTGMPVMEKIIHSLQEKKANKFYLITNMEDGSKAAGGDAKAGEAPEKPAPH